MPPCPGLISPVMRKATGTILCRAISTPTLERKTSSDGRKLKVVPETQVELFKHLRRGSSSDSDVNRLCPGQLPKEQIHIKAESAPPTQREGEKS